LAWSYNTAKMQSSDINPGCWIWHIECFGNGLKFLQFSEGFIALCTNVCTISFIYCIFLVIEWKLPPWQIQKPDISIDYEFHVFINMYAQLIIDTFQAQNVTNIIPSKTDKDRQTFHTKITRITCVFYRQIKYQSANDSSNLGLDRILGII
jgi:hypothetical protein